MNIFNKICSAGFTPHQSTAGDEVQGAFSFTAHHPALEDQSVPIPWRGSGEGCAAPVASFATSPGRSPQHEQCVSRHGGCPGAEHPPHSAHSLEPAGLQKGHGDQAGRQQMLADCSGHSRSIYSIYSMGTGRRDGLQLQCQFDNS